MLAVRVAALVAVLGGAGGPAARAAGSKPTAWASVWKMAGQSDLIAIVTVKSIDLDANSMKVEVDKVLAAEGKAPRRLVFTYFAGDDLPDRVPAGSRAVAFLVLARRRWTPAYADGGYGVWSVQDGEVVEWLEGKRQGEFYSLAEVSRRIVKWARQHVPR